MCVKCNTKKGNNETPRDLEVAKFRQHWKNIYSNCERNLFYYVPNFLKRYRSLMKLVAKLRDLYLHKVTYVVAKVTA